MNEQLTTGAVLLYLSFGFLCGFPMLLILISALIPNFFECARHTTSTHPWQSFFLGLVNFVFFLAIVAVFVDAAIVPLKVMAILSLFVMLPLMTVIGLVTAAGITGERILALLTKRPGTLLGRLVIGIICLGIISVLVPIVGWSVLVALVMTGFGAALLVLFRPNGVIPVDSQPESPVVPETPEIPVGPEISSEM